MTLDLQGVTTKAGLHALFKERLHFPDWYGANWDALFDCIVAIVPMPAELRLINWQEFAAAAPRDMDILRRVVVDYAQEMPGYRIVLG
ncbi:ribonuclease inhibitor [Hymenobacter sp. RP-2-7]|uniref:Ribonuclease inhibitor n=1 Tax=Hymenobacter polaris TaxID=2682546 RepID=A0A7Y0AB43_9BACT|nr:barstar family protein [Hymenobacter polaris]NML63845.1 ribonuclease inhibitor [Hymenobacter polaris]